MSTPMGDALLLPLAEYPRWDEVEEVDEEGEKHYPGGQTHDQMEHGNWASSATAGGTSTRDLTIDTVTPQDWADDWREGFTAMMKSFGLPDDHIAKIVGDGATHLPKTAVRVRDEDGNQVYVIDRTGKASDVDMRRAGRYVMEFMQRDPQDHLSNGRDAMHLQVSIVDQMSVKDGPGVLGSSRMDGQDIEFKPAALTLRRGNRGEWMPAADEGPLLRYLIAHEYGHIRATSKYGRPDSFDRLPRFEAQSEYARTNRFESYAEGYAQWVIDKSVVPELADVAREEGWPGA